jgi:hypothetical protein
MTLSRIAIPSPNYSSRGGWEVSLIVLHTAEGATTYQDLGAYFANPASGVSSHVGIDDTPDVVGEYVRRDGKAWTAANANPVAVQAELCAFAAWDNAEWHRHMPMLANTAAWIAEEAAYFHIPIRKLTPAQAQAGGPGVCQHADLGSAGGGHWDCGPGFPIDEVLLMAGGALPGDDDMPLNDDDKNWITKAINDALRQQFAPTGECYGRVRGATNDSIQGNEGNYTRWAETGAAEALK